jgi:hypothetical protein
MFIDSRYAAPSSSTLGRRRKSRPLRMTYPSSSSVSRQRRAVAAGIAAARAISLSVKEGCSRVNTLMTASPLASPPMASRRSEVELRIFIAAILFDMRKRRWRKSTASLDGSGARVHDTSYIESYFGIRKKALPTQEGLKRSEDRTSGAPDLGYFGIEPRQDRGPRP